MRTIAGVACLLAAAGGLGAAAAQARAAAGNGQIVAVKRLGDQDALVTFNPDGTGLRTIATFASGELSAPAWSPDGNRIAFVLDKVEHSARVYVNELTTGVSRRVTDAPPRNTSLDEPIDDSAPSWSPDGARLAFLRARDSATPDSPTSIRTVRADGSDERIVAMEDPDRPPFWPAWSPVADRIAYFVDQLPPYDVTTRAALRTIASDGKGISTVFQDATGLKADPQWAPDGSRIVYTDWPLGPSTNLRVVDVATGVPSDLTPPVDGIHVDAPDWAPDGSAVVYGSRSWQGGWLEVVAADGSSSRIVSVNGRDRDHGLREPDWQPCVAGVTVSCTSVTRAPTCLASPPASTPQDTAFALPPPSCSDPQGLPLTISIVQAPAHGALAAPGIGGSRRYTPQRGFAGQDVFRYQASNGTVASDVGTVTINVLAVGGGAAGDRGAARDTVAPTVQWLSRLRADRLGRVRVRVRCNERCVLSLRLSTKLRSGKTMAGPAKTVTAAAARTTTITLAIRRRGQKLSLAQVRSVAVTGSVKDAAANRRSLLRSVRRR